MRAYCACVVRGCRSRTVPQGRQELLTLNAVFCPFPLLPIRTRPCRHPAGEPGEMDGRLTVSRKWRAPLGSGQAASRSACLCRMLP